jgi:hypothetical protein
MATNQADPLARQLRNAADQLEQGLADLADLADVSFPSVDGDLRRFPRPAPEDEVVVRGLEFLREDAGRANAVLRAAARAADQDLLRPASPLLAFIRQRYLFPPPPQQPPQRRGGSRRRAPA